MSVIFVIGVLILVFLAIIILCLAAIWLEKNLPSEKFDERQVMAQGRGWRLSGFVSMLYYACVTVQLIKQVEQGKTIEPYILVFGGVLLQSVVYNVYTLFTYSFTEPARKPWKIVFVFLIDAVLLAVTAWIFMKQYPLAYVGEGSAAWIFILASFVGVFLATLHLLHLLRRDKE